MNISIICFANFCRSPVAEKILQNNLNNKFKIKSYGIIQFDRKGMHEYSEEYLANLGCTNLKHNPSKLTEEDVRNSDIIYVVTCEIQKILMQQFPLYSGKFKLICPNEIADPIKMKKEEYFKVLDEINEQCKEISKKLNKIF